jgi:hypothetical protein
MGSKAGANLSGAPCGARTVALHTNIGLRTSSLTFLGVSDEGKKVL